MNWQHHSASKASLVHYQASLCTYVQCSSASIGLVTIVCVFEYSSQDKGWQHCLSHKHSAHQPHSYNHFKEGFFSSVN